MNKDRSPDNSVEIITMKGDYFKIHHLSLDTARELAHYIVNQPPEEKGKLKNMELDDIFVDSKDLDDLGFDSTNTC